MNQKYYTGIGSRDCPESILTLIKEIAADLCQNGWILRSGGANGCDSAFEQGCFEGFLNLNTNATNVYDHMEIYLPWKKFNNNPSPLYHIPQEAFKMAEEIHPNWKACKIGPMKLHARNCLQVLGRDLNTPSQFLLCWSEPQGNSISGGTRTAYELAKKNNIPVYNMYNKEREETMEWINAHCVRPN